VKFGKVDRRLGSGNTAYDVNADTVESLLAVAESGRKPQSHRTVREIHMRRGESVNHQFRRLSASQVLQD